MGLGGQRCRGRDLGATGELSKPGGGLLQTHQLPRPCRRSVPTKSSPPSSKIRRGSCLEKLAKRSYRDTTRTLVWVSRRPRRYRDPRKKGGDSCLRTCVQALVALPTSECLLRGLLGIVVFLWGHAPCSFQELPVQAVFLFLIPSGHRGHLH